MAKQELARMEHGGLGKMSRKDDDANQRSRRAPDCAELLKWVKAWVKGNWSRQASWR